MKSALKMGLFVRLYAKPGKERELQEFLEKGLEMAKEEPTTPLWFAVRFSPTAFAIFDAFEGDTGRQTHLDGPIAKALLTQAAGLLAQPPVIEHWDVVGAKAA